MTTAPITLYTGRPAIYARLAAYWLHRLAEYRHWGRAGSKLRRTCHANHIRNVENAVNEVRLASLLARSEAALATGSEGTL